MSHIWLIIWRFQPFHNGHILLIQESLKHQSATLVLIGSSNVINTKNPWSFEQRKKMIAGHYPDTSSLHIWAIPDFQKDDDWKDFLLHYIPKWEVEVTLYWWDIKNDSAIATVLHFRDTLPFSLKVVEIPRSIIPISATDVRWWIQENNTGKLSEYLPKSSLESIK